MANTISTHQPGPLQSAAAGVTTITTVVVGLWFIHAVNVAVGLNGYGIVPRTVDGLSGIIAAPFLHGSVSHIALNTVSLAILGSITMVRRRADFFLVSAVSAFTSGLGVWLIGAAGTTTIGASGVIFGYLGFLMARGFFERSLSAIALSAIVIWFFGGMVWGVLPTVGPMISWEAHLFGFLGGVGTARVLGKGIRRERRRQLASA
ncbi:MAG: rhomboid family intramembrane serine protease [Myxococcales bacterium]|nr:rhomboid family intramembrane serine protease [Myxococcales bacterium]